jgi:hypothetical protein
MAVTHFLSSCVLLMESMLLCPYLPFYNLMAFNMAVNNLLSSCVLLTEVNCCSAPTCPFYNLTKCFSGPTRLLYNLMVLACISWLFLCVYPQVADGVNWGEPARRAARCAVLGSTEHLHQMLQEHQGAHAFCSK